MPNLNLNASWGQFFPVTPHDLPERRSAERKSGSRCGQTTTSWGFLSFQGTTFAITVEGLRKRLQKSYPVSSQYPSLTLANSGDDFGVDRPAVPHGKRRQRTLRLAPNSTCRKSLRITIYGQLSYSYSETEHQALDGVRRPASFDIPHTFTLAGWVQNG